MHRVLMYRRFSGKNLILSFNCDLTQLGFFYEESLNIRLGKQVCKAIVRRKTKMGQKMY
jgi:hypothetical protein